MSKQPGRRRIQHAAAVTSGEVLPRGKSDQDIRSQADRAIAAGISVRTQGKLDYLAQQQPELLAAVHSGQMSVDQAYRQARGKSHKKISLLERVKRIWTAASLQERREIARWVMAADQADQEAKT